MSISVTIRAAIIVTKVLRKHFEITTGKHSNGIITKGGYRGYTQKNGADSKVNKKFISHLHGHNVHRQQQQLSKFLMRYQQFASHAQFRKDAPGRCVFYKPCTKLRLHCNHRSGHFKTEHTESFFLLRRHLGNWPRDPAVSMRSELLVADEKLGELLLLTVYVVPV